MDNRSRTVPLIDVAVVVAGGFVAHALLRSLGLGVGISALGTLAMLALATGFLARRHLSWRDLGFRRPENMRSAAMWGVGLFLADMLVVPAVMGALADALQLPPQKLGAFADLKGDTIQYLVILIPIGWGVAAFGEEMIYRGFIYRRLSDAFAGAPFATGAAQLGQAALFALGHAYLGPRGVLNAALLGILAGVVYIRNGRNLWPLIIAHGLVDTVGLTALYLGVAHA